MRVIGTAGHVDHGKSTLIEALTGTHPDRLKEEREREMTIDLGFAWLELPIGETGVIEEVGIVDVPGHRDFIENMLAGIGGIDAALFVIAADEGVMPQTREHLAILDILQIQGGVVVLNKIDLIEDPDWLDLVESDIQQVLMGTIFENAPIVRVSARTGAGLTELKQQLGEILALCPPRPDLGRPRLPVDRVFTISGFGTIVTGTLSDGRLQVGDELDILPLSIRGRVRGLQTHKQKEQTAQPGSRTAVNISGVAIEQIQRGNVVTHPGDYRVTQRLDVRFSLLPDVGLSLKHNTEVKLFIGASEVLARLRLLGIEELRPGHEGWLQLELVHPVVATRGDHYILRRPSPGETLGGGVIVDPHPSGRHKRFATSTLANLEAIATGSPSDVIIQALVALGAAPLKEVLAKSNLEERIAKEALSELFQSGMVVNLDGKSVLEDWNPETLVISKSQWIQLSQRILNEVGNYHKNFPLRSGLPREELKSRLKNVTHGSTRLFNTALRMLIAEDQLVEEGPLVFLPEHSIQFTSLQQKQVDLLLARFASSPFSPPTAKECQQALGEELFNALVETKQLISVDADVVFRKTDFDSMVLDVKKMIQQNGSLTVAHARDHFNTSRRYVLAFLEYLDSIGVTQRSGDERRLK